MKKPPGTGPRRRWPSHLAIGISVAVLVAMCAAAGSGSLFAQQSKGAPSKIAGIVQDRIDRLRLASAAGGLSPAARGLSTAALVVTDDGQLEVEVHAAGAVSADESAALEGLGATVLASTGTVRWPAGVTRPSNLAIITARIPADRIATVAALEWVVAITPAEKESPDAGAFVSEGVILHKTDQANTLGLDGTGVSVGAISDGVSNLAAAQALGDLPPGVNVLN